MKVLLFLLSGNAEKIATANKINLDNLEVIKIDEKELSKPIKLVKMLNKVSAESIFFGTIDNRFQRFQTFMKIYFLLSFSFRGAIIDEFGNCNKFSLLKFAFVELPMLILEIFYSVCLIIIYHLKVYWLKWKYTRN